MTNVAAKVRQEKEMFPDRFCAVRGCLWRVVTKDGPSPCRKHPVQPARTPDPEDGGCDVCDDPTCYRNQRPTPPSDDSDDEFEDDDSIADPIGPEPESEFFENAWHVRGRYYASADDAEFWRKIDAERRERTRARIAAYEARLREATNHISEVA